MPSSLRTVEARPDSQPPDAPPCPQAQNLDPPLYLSNQLDLTESPTSPLHSRIASQHYCGKGSVIGLSPKLNHAVIVPLFCKSWDCPRCGPRKRAQWIARIAAGKPQRRLELTMPVTNLHDVRGNAIILKKAFSKLVAMIRRRFGTFEFASVVELTHRGMPHLHILFRGSYIPKRWLSIRWNNLGIGPIVNIGSVTSYRQQAAHLCKYLSKDTGQSAAKIAPLRIVQLSSGYDLPETKPKANPEWKEFSWTYTHEDPQTIAHRLAESPIAKTVLFLESGGYEFIFATEHQVLDFLADPPRRSPILVVFPDSNPSGDTLPTPKNEEIRNTT